MEGGQLSGITKRWPSDEESMSNDDKSVVRNE